MVLFKIANQMMNDEEAKKMNYPIKIEYLFFDPGEGGYWSDFREILLA